MSEKHRYTLRWSERAIYEVTIETDLTAEQLEEHTGPDGEDLWFALVEAQQPDWATQNLLEVSERELEEIEPAKPRGQYWPARVEPDA